MSQQKAIHSFFCKRSATKRPGEDDLHDQEASAKRVTGDPGQAALISSKLPASAGTASSEMSSQSPGMGGTNTPAPAKGPLDTQAKQPPAERTSAAAERQASQAATGDLQLSLQGLLVEAGWKTALSAEFQKPYFRNLERFLQEEWRQHQIFPKQGDIFRALNSCPIEQARVVILGQDPYHNFGQAMGMSFSVPRGQPKPSSLNNIFRELNADCGCSIPRHGDLQEGWEDFTDAAIRTLNVQRKGLIFLLWGRHAQVKASKGLIDKSRHHVLQAAHPSGLSANKGFFGCRHFSQANALLEKQGMAPITWQLSVGN